MATQEKIRKQIEFFLTATDLSTFEIAEKTGVSEEYVENILKQK